MDRRFATFLALTVLLWTGFIAAQLYFGPKQPLPVAEKPGDEKPGGQPDGKDIAADKRVKPADKLAKDDARPAEAPEIKAAAPEIAEPLTYCTLGSLDPASGVSMLVTCVSRGAAIERVELNSLRYKSVEDQSGYLGHLALRDSKSGGAEVNVVGPGTPAALAKATGTIGPGLVVGDVIKKIDDQEVEDATTLTTYLETKTRPDQSVTLLVKRKDFPQPFEFTALLIRRPMEIVRPEDHAYKNATARCSSWDSINRRCCCRLTVSAAAHCEVRRRKSPVCLFCALRIGRSNRKAPTSSSSAPRSTKARWPGSRRPAR